MSLVGNLEELGLGEILQIVSISRKTGVLSLSSKGKESSVFFRQGQVVRAESSACQQSLGEVLIKKGIIDLGLLRTALAYQQENGFDERLGVILVKKFGVSPEIIEEVVREQIENVVFSLFTWIYGTFKFEVKASIETVDETDMDPLQFMLDQGLNPQFLAMEGSRILEDFLHSAEIGSTRCETPADGDDIEFDLVDSSISPASIPLEIPQSLVVVDDDGPTLRAITEGLTAQGFVVHAMTRSEDTLIKVDALQRSGDRPVVLIDMIMPKMDGSGVLGGIELLELLHNNFPTIRLIIMSDYHHAEAENRILEIGHSFVMKPRRAEIKSPTVLDEFITKLALNLNAN